jgi:type II secretory pathway component GspD/PulD (secretin)
MSDENGKKKWTRELIPAETHGEGLKCHSMTPSANPQKKLVADYDTNAIILKGKRQIVRAATKLLEHADRPGIDDDDVTVIMKVDRKPCVKTEGHRLNIVLQRKKQK